MHFVQEIVGVSIEQQGSWSTKHILVQSFLILKGLVLPKKKKEKKVVLVMRLSACAEWILNFVQEIAGVSTYP